MLVETMVKWAFALWLVIGLSVAGCQQPGDASKTNTPAKENAAHKSNAQHAPGRETRPRHDGGLDRDPSRLIYSKHARCRMDCRHIDESEVQEILLQGRINERKSEPAGRPDPKYALEGKTRDGQEVRIVFAMAKRGIVVVTVIDLGTEWTSNCK